MIPVTETNVDGREALFNNCAQGPVHTIQVPTERITRLHGILFDLDPKLLVPGNPLFPPADDTRAFYAAVRPVLERHPLARQAEVRSSGTGLHVILGLHPAVELLTEAEQRHWGAIVKMIQCTLPIDPDMPGITALTRPVGSINSKNGAAVEILKPGAPVAVKVVEDYLTRLQRAPFREIALPILGAERFQPCPVCGRANSRLDVLDHIGKCYNGCSKITLDKLYDCILQPVKPENGSGGATRPKAKNKTLVGLIKGKVASN